VNRARGNWMNYLAWWCGVAVCLLAPALSEAQSTGRIECARNDDYVYLYSSVVTLEVRGTLQCGEVVQIIDRYDSYITVRNAKGKTGFVPQGSVVVLKDQMGTGLPAVTAEPSARERIHYDESTRPAPAAGRVAAGGFVFANNTAIRVKLSKTISSATAHAGDAVEFEVVEDISVDGVVVLNKGSKVSGVIVEAEPKKRWGHGGQIAFKITTLRVGDGEQVGVRCYEKVSGSTNTSSDAAVPLASGKDVSMLEGAEFTMLVDGDVALKREGFSTPKDVAAAAPGAPVETAKP
jgi:hypothetical protein